MAHDPQTRAYIDRKMLEGETKREAVCCSYHCIAREAYRLLTGPQGAPCDKGARRDRTALGISQAEAAEGAGIILSEAGRRSFAEGYIVAVLIGTVNYR